MRLNLHRLRCEFSRHHGYVGQERAGYCKTSQSKVEQYSRPPRSKEKSLFPCDTVKMTSVYVCVLQLEISIKVVLFPII